MVKAPPEAFEKLPDETPSAFQAFVLYRDMGPKRTMAQVGRQLQITSTQTDKWARRYLWVKRAAAFDAWQDKLKLERTKKHIDKLARVNARIALAGQIKLYESLKHITPESITPAMFPNWLRALAEVEKTARQGALKVELTGGGGGPIAHTIEHDLKEAAQSIVRKLGEELADSEKESFFAESDPDGEGDA